MTIICRTCGGALEVEDRFCTKCGSPTGDAINMCDHCGADVAPGSTRCPVCGHATGPASAAPAAQTPAAVAVCASCGEERIEGNAFCIFCGAKYEDVPASVPASVPADQATSTAVGSAEEPAPSSAPTVLNYTDDSFSRTAHTILESSVSQTREAADPAQKLSAFEEMLVNPRLFVKSDEEPLDDTVVADGTELFDAVEFGEFGEDGFASVPDTPSFARGFANPPETGLGVEPSSEQESAQEAPAPDPEPALDPARDNPADVTQRASYVDDELASDDTPAAVDAPVQDGSASPDAALEPEQVSEMPESSSPESRASELEDGFDLSMDDATMVLEYAPEVYLVRMGNSERLDMQLPAVVGKGSAATCRVAGNSAISRTHVCIAVEPFPDFNCYTLENLGSTNKTMVDGVLVEAGEKVTLQDGSVIMLANEEFEFHVQ